MDELPSINDQPILQDEWGNDGYYDEYTGNEFQDILFHCARNLFFIIYFDRINNPIPQF